MSLAIWGEQPERKRIAPHGRYARRCPHRGFVLAPAPMVTGGYGKSGHIPATVSAQCVCSRLDEAPLGACVCLVPMYPPSYAEISEPVWV